MSCCDEFISDIRKIVLGKNIENDKLIRRLESDGCLYLLSKIPAQKMKSVIAQAANLIIQKNRYYVCKDVIADLIGIKYAVIKGAVLSDIIYKNPAYRISGDIDLLVSPNDAEKVKEILLKHGFIQGHIENGTIVPYTRRELIYQKTYTHQLASFIKRTDKENCPFVNIDVNLDIMWGESEQHIDMDEFLFHRYPYPLFGIELHVLDAEHMFISLCMHHYKDLNSVYLISERGISLALFCDIYYYIINVKPDKDSLYLESKKYSVDEYVYYCIYYTSKLFDDDKLKEYLKAFQNSHNEELLSGYGLAGDERHMWQISFEERLFDTGFREKFTSALTEKERKKIETNRRFM